jgi:DNA-binding beta-propeller fold protein YncE
VIGRYSIVCLTFFISVAAAQIPGVGEKRVLLPNGWWLSPAGEQIALGDFPTNAVLSDNERFLAVSHSGELKAEIELVDLKEKKVVQKIRLADTWYGLKFSGRMLYVSGGYRNCVYLFRLAAGRLAAEDTVRFAAPYPKYDGALQGLDVLGNRLAAVFRNDSTLRIMNMASRSQKIVKLDGMPYTCIFLPNGTLLVSIWGSRKIEAFRQTKFEYEIPTGDHPNEIAVSRNGKYAFVACANDNTVTVIDLVRRKAVASVSTAIHPDAPEGSTTNSVALTGDQKELVAANADNNSLTIMNVEKPERPVPVGFVPVGWYPTKVLILKNRTLLVVNGKGGRSFANPDGTYIAHLMVGSLSILPVPDDDKLREYSRRVLDNTPYEQKQLLSVPYPEESAIPHKVGDPSPIKHVLYIIKENRTYDQVLGDMPEGNGDSSLCIFGRDVTPNHHTLARDYALFDNFYVNSEVSADGHNWSMAGYATDYVEKTWPTLYGKRGGVYNFEGGQPCATPASGFLWNIAAVHNVSYRSYGEFITTNDTIGNAGTARDPGLRGHFAPLYRGWDLKFSDVDRFKEWEKEFSEYEKNGRLPQLCIMHLPNDHTAGSKRGSWTPRAYVAQNDYALGLIVERVSRSRFWDETAVFVVEDDAQSGPDHVDAHRSVALVISPWVKRHFVDHTLYSTASMLRTMELILGLPPMSQYDAAATPMFTAFTTVADTNRYTAEGPRIDLNERNKSGSYGEMLMEKFNLDTEDAIPDREFNEILWRVVTGRPSPAPRYSIFSRRSLVEERDE